MKASDRNRHRITAALQACLLLTAGLLNAVQPRLHVEGNQFKDPSGNVVILRGVSMIDVGATQEWYGGVNALIDRLTNTSDPAGSSPGWYTRIVRIACYPPDGGFTSPNGWQPGSDTFYNNLLRPLVDYCGSKNLYVIIDWHYIDDSGPHDTMTRNFWTYMAPKFANDTHVLYEMYNEPINGTGSTDQEKWNNWRNNYAQPYANIIRAAAPSTIILVGGPSWSQIIGGSASNPVTGGNIAYVSHIYPIHWHDSGTRAWITNHVTTAHAVAPVILTEWGFSSSNCDDITCGTISDFGQPLKDFITANGLSWTAWCANYEWKPPMYANSSYTLLVGSGEMGGFTKDWLYATRNSDQPGGGGTQAPYGGTPKALPGKVEAENYDTGGEGVAYHDTDTGNSGGQYRSDGVDIETTTDTGGGYNVGWINAGEWTEYTVNVGTAGTYTIEARVASSSTGGTLHVEFGGVNKTGAMTFSATGGWQTWTTVTKTGVSLSAGQQVMRLSMDSGAFNVNWVNIVSGGSVPAAPSGLSASAVSSSQINLAWTDNASNETGFKIERKTGSGGTYAQIATTAANVTTYNNTGLSASTTYYYRVRAANGTGDSGYSNEASATTPAGTSAELLTNPGMESGTTGWSGQGCTIASNTSYKHSGTYSLRATSRTAAWAGPLQILTSAVSSNGQGTYTISAWMRMSSGSATGKVTLRLTSDAGTTYLGVTGGTVGTSWVQVKGTVNATWSGTLTEAAFYIETTSGTTSFYADDCSVKKGIAKASDRPEDETDGTAVPEVFSLEDNRPNPFNPETLIGYRLNESARVRLEIFDVVGHRIKVLVDDELSAGNYDVRWNALDEAGRRVASGIYLYRITVVGSDGAAVSTAKRMTLLK